MDKMSFGAMSTPQKDTLESLTKELVEVLEKINRIRPVQFLDFESEYVYNFLRLREDKGYDRVWIEISGRYDNLPSHASQPLRDSRNQVIPPSEELATPVSD